MPDPSSAQLDILLHSMGLTDSQESYRNHFVTGPGSNDHTDCMKLVGMGFMVRRKGNELTGGGDLFLVTKAGEMYAHRNKPKPEKLTRSQRRYRRWLNAESSQKFGEWIRRNS